MQQVRKGLFERRRYGYREDSFAVDKQYVDRTYPFLIDPKKLNKKMKT